MCVWQAPNVRMGTPVMDLLVQFPDAQSRRLTCWSKTKFRFGTLQLLKWRIFFMFRKLSREPKGGRSTPHAPERIKKFANQPCKGCLGVAWCHLDCLVPLGSCIAWRKKISGRSISQQCIGIVEETCVCLAENHSNSLPRALIFDRGMSLHVFVCVCTHPYKAETKLQGKRSRRVYFWHTG